MNKTTKLVITGCVLLVGVILICSFASSFFFTIPPGTRGIKIAFGKVEETTAEPGLHLKAPYTNIKEINIQQDTKDVTAECFSSDLQGVNLRIKVLYRIPSDYVVTIFRDYYGDPFDKLILPRVQEATKEVTALKTAAEIAKTREAVKSDALASARKKIGSILIIDDLVIEDVGLSKDLEKAIEGKMVQQQEAEKALFKKQQALTDAETAIIKAKGEAEAIRVQGEALEKNPRLVDLEMVKKWNGVSPQIVGAGMNIMLPTTLAPKSLPLADPDAPAATPARVPKS